MIAGPEKKNITQLENKSIAAHTTSQKLERKEREQMNEIEKEHTVTALLRVCTAAVFTVCEGGGTNRKKKERKRREKRYIYLFIYLGEIMSNSARGTSVTALGSL